MPDITPVYFNLKTSLTAQKLKGLCYFFIFFLRIGPVIFAKLKTRWRVPRA